MWCHSFRSLSLSLLLSPRSGSSLDPWTNSQFWNSGISFCWGYETGSCYRLKHLLLDLNICYLLEILWCSALAAQTLIPFLTSQLQNNFESCSGPCNGLPASLQAFQTALIFTVICFRVRVVVWWRSLRRNWCLHEL